MSSSRSAPSRGTRTTARATVWLGLALLLAGALFGSPSLYVPGIGLLALAAAALAWVRTAAREVAVEREPGPSTVIEGEPYPLRVSISRGRIPLPGGELRDPGLERPIPLGPNPPGSLAETVRMERRGRHHLEPVVLVVRDPLGLGEAQVSGGETADILVLPRTEPLSAATEAAGGGGGSGAGRTGDDAEGGVLGVGRQTAALASEIDGVRPHQEGAPASRIHWRSVARSGELVDRRLTPGSEASHAILLDTGGGAGGADEEALDAAVRAAGSLCLHLAPAGGCDLLLPGGPGPLRIDAGLRSWPHAHARLALVEATDGPTLLPRARRRGNAVWVRSDPEPPAGAELARIAATASHLVLPGRVPGLTAEFSVTGCLGYPLSAGRAIRPRQGARAA